MVVNVGETKQIKDMAITSLQVKPFDNKLPVKQCLIWRAIAGLLWFEQICPLEIPVLGHFSHTSICLSKEKETKKCNFFLCEIFLTQYFGLRFRSTNG